MSDVSSLFCLCYTVCSTQHKCKICKLNICMCACVYGVSPACCVLSVYASVSPSAVRLANHRSQATICRDLSLLVCPQTLLSEPQDTDLRAGDKEQTGKMWQS